MEFHDLYEPQSEPTVRPFALPPLKLQELRRTQLLNLARAYEIPMPVGGNKSDILPLMVAAQNAGKFQGRPMDYHALAKALQSPDDEPHPRPWELVGLSEELWNRYERGGYIDKNAVKVHKVGGRQWMLKRAKELGLKMPFGVKNDALIQALKDAGEEWEDG